MQAEPIDSNEDGVPDLFTEPGIGGISVVLVTSDGSVVARTETDADGRFDFDSLRIPEIVPGAELVVVIDRTQPELADTHQTQPTAGNDIQNDSNGIWQV